MRLLLVLAASIGLANAFLSPLEREEDAEVFKRQAYPYPAFTIDQPIDHFPHDHKYAPHETGTFKQRYFFDDTYYKPGGPVYLYISGETSGESRFSNLKTGTIADNAYFAQHATFPGVSGNLTAPGTPWILYGGSLAGGETAFSVISYGDILFGGIASSAPVKTVLAYPQWYDPIQKFGPQDCIASINAIINKINDLVDSKNGAAIQQLKTIFGLQDLPDIRDFAMTIAYPLGGPFNYPTSTWQELSWYPAYSGPDFFNFCSNITNINAPANITAVDYALANYTNGEPWTNLGNYANYFQQQFLETGICPNGDFDTILECYGTQNASYWADTTNGGGRSYLYTTCTELGAYQVAPSSGPSLIMNVLQVDYTQQWCTWAFPPGKYNQIPSTPDLRAFNKYGSFNIKADRLAFIDGGVDVWLDLCYHSNFAPLRESSDLNPEYLIAGAGHHWDSSGILDVSAEPLFIQQAHLWEIKTVQKWLKTFPDWQK
ncbi:hypothetical protein EG329_005854 [Mollisiaceae sp. DMI_Dod_QoI]|nr:hypothetical protein EG329_005854 [Helotiales sp. DMI_Dod_QoI]